MGKVQREPLVEPGVPAAAGVPATAGMAAAAGVPATAGVPAAAGMAATAGMAGLLPTSRKYLGSKHALAGWICDRIVAAAGLPRTFLDGFAGTGAIAVELARRGAPTITCVDNLLSNTVVLDAHFTPLPAAQQALVAQWLERLRALPGSSGYVTAAYGGRYFTYPNARRIDAVREAIAAAAAAGAGRPVIQALLASLILGADRAANTVGQYDAFLKHLGRPAVSDGRHLVDARVYQPLRLVPVAVAPVGARVITADLLAMIGTLEVEVAYVDPPYNDRQYSSNYHVLENLARWERPPVTGKTRKFPSDHLKSPFSRRREVRGAFERMVERCRAPLLFVSYNSEGLLAIDELERILATAGTVTRWDHRYPVFGHGAGVARKRTVTEHLLALRRGRGRRG